MSSKLARLLKELRENAGLSQNALAMRAGVSAAFINKLEDGAYSTLSVDKTRDLAKGLDMSFRDFLEAVGLLEESATPNADAALASALRKRGVNSPAQINEVIRYADYLKKSAKK